MTDSMATFEDRAVWLMEKLLPDFPAWGIDDAAADAGNAGGESEILMVQEAGMSPPNGGFGFYQWTGARRTAFESYCARTKRDPNSMQSGYDFHFVELKGTYANVIGLVAAAPDLNAKTLAFEQHYEMAGIPRMGARDQFAARAKAAYVAKHGSALAPVPPPVVPAPGPSSSPAPPLVVPNLGSLLTEALDLYEKLAPLIPDGVKTAVVNAAVQAVLSTLTSATQPSAASSQGNTLMSASFLKVIFGIIGAAGPAVFAALPPPWNLIGAALLSSGIFGHAITSAVATDPAQKG